MPQPKSTPLLDALKAEKSAIKDKEAILRNHAHYNQIVTPASRKEDKKKPTPAPQPQASKASEGAPANVVNGAIGTGGKKSFKKGHHAPPPPVVALPKAATATDLASKNPADGTVAEPAKPPKAPRAHRVAAQSKNHSNHSNPDTVGDTPAAPSEASARRSRPVVGLASRQFEAALSGVGARDRRAKGERGKEKESSAPASNVDGPSSEATPASPPVAVLPIHGASGDKVAPPSPKKDRTRRGGGRNSGGGGGASGGPPIKVSGILQRVDTAPPASTEQGASEGSINVSVNPTTTSGVVGNGNKGGGRRGRGGHAKEKGVVPPAIKSGG